MYHWASLGYIVPDYKRIQQWVLKENGKKHKNQLLAKTGISFGINEYIVSGYKRVQQ